MFQAVTKYSREEPDLALKELPGGRISLGLKAGGGLNLAIVLNDRATNSIIAEHGSALLHISASQLIPTLLKEVSPLFRRWPRLALYRAGSELAAEFPEISSGYVN